MTCSAQSRKKSAQKMVTATTPRMAIRIAAWGVTRYGSSTLGSGGRNPPGRLALGVDNRDHLPPFARSDGEDPAAEPVERIGEEEVERQGREEHPDEELRSRDRLPEHEMQYCRPESHADGPDRHGEQGGVRGGLLRHLAEAAGEVAGEGEQERCKPERLESDDVEDEPGPETCGGAEGGPAQKRDRDHEHEQKIGVSGRDLDVGRDRDLDEGGEQKEHAGLERVERHFGRAIGTRTMTSASESKFTRGAIWIRL